MVDQVDPHLQQLRLAAEKNLHELEGSRPENKQKAEILHELRVYQAELELQNQQLRETQQSLQQSLERFNALYHRSPIGYVTLDAHGQIQELNNSFAHMLGYPTDSLRHKYLASYCNVDTAEVLRQRLPAFFKKPQGKILDLGLINKDGATLLVEVQGQKLPGEKTLACNVIDRTERRLAEEARKDSEAQLRAVTAAARNAILMVNSSGLITYGNPACERVLGYSLSELLGQNLHKLLVPEHYLPDYRRNFEQFRRDGKGNIINKTVELTARHKSGEILDVELSLSAVAIKGEWHGVGIIRDISTFKKNERTLSDRTAELEQRTEELEIFNYTVSHDLKSPLVTVKTFLGFLEQDMRTGDSEAIEQDLHHIRTATDRMGLLLDDLLQLSRSSWVANQTEQISLKGLLEHTLMFVQGQIEETGARITLPDTDLLLHADPSRLLEIWQNLIDNALTYGVTKENPHIDIGFESGAEPVFYVRDFGPGIAREFHEKIFGLFEKLDRNSKGSGLGLALVKRIVEKHSGKIWVEAGENEPGCCIKFTLPTAFLVPATDQGDDK